MNNPVPFSQIRLSVVVTVYTETFAVAETIKRLMQNDRRYIYEIILLVSPRSSRQTLDICKSQAASSSLVKIVIQKNNPGLGWAYREGMAEARGNYVALMSGDLETEPEAVDRMVREIEQTGCDGVITNRWLKGGGFTGYNPLKLVLNWLFQKIFGILYRTKLGDLTYGFKILSKAIVKGIAWESTRHEICIETTVKPLKAGFYLEQVPSVWIGRREGMSMNSFFANFRYVKMALGVLFQPKSELFI